MRSKRKITILGAGNVGATIAYTLTLDGVCSEIVLIDIDKEKAMGEAMDIRQGLAFSRSVNIHAGEYSDAADSDIVVVTSGAARKPGQTRIDLAQTNVNILKSVLDSVTKYAPNAIYVVVSNPVDVLTYVTIKYTNLAPSQVIGSGTLLDSSRLRSIISERLNLIPQNIHGYVLGEHGDSSVVPWSAITVAGMPITAYCENVNGEFSYADEAERLATAEEMRTSGATVISYKRSTYYAIAMSVKHLCERILRNANCVMAVSTLIEGQYGIDDVCLSLPCVVGSHGIEKILTVPLTDKEIDELRNSANVLKNTIASLDL